MYCYKRKNVATQNCEKHFLFLIQPQQFVTFIFEFGNRQNSFSSDPFWSARYLNFVQNTNWDIPSLFLQESDKLRILIIHPKRRHQLKGLVFLCNHQYYQYLLVHLHVYHLLDSELAKSYVKYEYTELYRILYIMVQIDECLQKCSTLLFICF